MNQSLKEKVVAIFGTNHAVRPAHNGGQPVEFFAPSSGGIVKEGQGVFREGDAEGPRYFDDIRDQGNGLVALSLERQVQVYVLKDEPAAGRLGQAQNPLPDGIRYLADDDALSVDGVKISRHFFAALASEFPIGACFRLDGRENGVLDVKEIPALPPAPDGSVALANAERLVELEHAVAQYDAVVRSHLSPMAGETALETLVRTANERGELLARQTQLEGRVKELEADLESATTPDTPAAGQPAA